MQYSYNSFKYQPQILSHMSFLCQFQLTYIPSHNRFYYLLFLKFFQKLLCISGNFRLDVRYCDLFLVHWIILNPPNMLELSFGTRSSYMKLVWSFWILLVSFASGDQSRVHSGVIFPQCGDKTLLGTLADARRVKEFFSLALRTKHYSQPHVSGDHYSLSSFQMGLSPAMCGFFTCSWVSTILNTWGEAVHRSCALLGFSCLVALSFGEPQCLWLPPVSNSVSLITSLCLAWVFPSSATTWKPS